VSGSSLMLKQRGYGNFPGVFLTFSLVLLVLAMGFVLGRVVIGRLYIKTAPSFEPKVAQRPEGTEDARPEDARRPGRVYVPAPPPQAPEGDLELEGTVAAAEEGEPAEPPAEASTQEETVEALPTAPPAVPEESEGRRYSIQVGVFISETGARKAAEELTRAGYPARVELAREGGETRYRVLAGRYRTEATARRALERIRQEGLQAFLVER
jgi:cell division protein FtsN